MERINFIKPKIKIYYATSAFRWCCTVNDVFYKSAHTIVELLDLMLCDTVISKKEYHKLLDDFNNKEGEIVWESRSK